MLLFNHRVKSISITGASVKIYKGVNNDEMVSAHAQSVALGVSTIFRKTSFRSQET